MPARLNPLFFRSLFSITSLVIVFSFAGCAREPDKEFPALTEVTLGTGKEAKTTEVPAEIHERISKEVSDLLGFSPDSLKMFGAEPLAITISREAGIVSYPELNHLHDLHKPLFDPEDDEDIKKYEDSDEFEEIEDIRDEYDNIEELRKNYLHLIWKGRFNADRMKKGHAIYAKRCVQCHGFNGDGNGPQAKHLYPRPRDYRKGIFKFISTSPVGSKALHSDLVKTVTRGVTGTSMPSFERLKKDDIEAVVDYVLALSHRGELTEKLTVLLVIEMPAPEKPASDADEETQKEYQEELASFELEYTTEKIGVIERILKDWMYGDNGKPLSALMPDTPQPRFTLEHIKKGKKIFNSVGCAGCHHVPGDPKADPGFDKFDDWHIRTKAAYLTSGIFHGGEEPIDLYRRIYVGINGTPMPTAMKSKEMQAFLKEDKDAVWSLVAYVLSLSETRRSTVDQQGRFIKGETPPSGKFELPNMRDAMNPDSSSATEKKEEKNKEKQEEK